MATKIASHSQPLLPLSLHSKFKTREFSAQFKPWLGRARTSTTRPKKRLMVRASIHDPIASSSDFLLVGHQLVQNHPSSSLFLLSAETAGYSLASYYTSLGLFVISVPGLWSLIKRSVKSKVLFKQYSNSFFFFLAHYRHIGTSNYLATAYTNSADNNLFF